MVVDDQPLLKQWSFGFETIQEIVDKRTCRLSFSSCTTLQSIDKFGELPIVFNTSYLKKLNNF